MRHVCMALGIEQMSNVVAIEHSKAEKNMFSNSSNSDIQCDIPRRRRSFWGIGVGVWIRCLVRV